MNNKTLFICVIFILFSCSSIFGQTWFESTPSGTLKKIITESETAEYKYYATLDIRGNVETITLFKDQEAYSSIKKTATGSGFILDLYQDEHLISSGEYISGLLVNERLYDEGHMLEKRIYKYNKKDFPVSVDALDEKNKQIYSEKYFYASNNSLSQVIREYQDGKNEFIAYTYDTKGNIKQIYESYSNESTLSYYHSNAKSDEISWHDGQKGEVRKWEQKGDFKYLVEEDLLSGSEKKYTYTLDNQLLKTVEKLDVFLKITDYDYEKDNLVSIKSRSAGLTENWNYEYDSENILSYEEYRKNGDLVTTMKYLKDDISVETIYRDSVPFLKLTYKDGKRISQEYIQDSTEKE